MNGQRILILAPHTDDGELGCGATMAKYAGEGAALFYAAFSTCAASLPPNLPPDTLEKECRKAISILGVQDVRFFDFPVREFSSHRQAILEALIILGQTLKPDVVFVPAEHDIHQDHQVICSEGLRAFKNKTVLGYELPWNNTRFQPTYFETITPGQMEKKQAALREYQSQAHRKYMNADFVRSLAHVRGMQAGAPFAEAFEVYRMVR